MDGDAARERGINGSRKRARSGSAVNGASLWTAAVQGAASGAAAEEMKRRCECEGGGGVMKEEESQMGQIARDRVNSVKELNVSSPWRLKDKDRCEARVQVSAL